MKIFKTGGYAICLLVIMASLSACASNRNYVDADEASQAHSRRELVAEGLRAADLAIMYSDQHSYYQAAVMFMDAADLFEQANAKDLFQAALTAAAKCQLQANRMELFTETLDRLEGSFCRFYRPTEDQMLLFNIRDRMNGKNPGYPEPWEIKSLFI